MRHATTPKKSAALYEGTADNSPPALPLSLAQSSLPKTEDQSSPPALSPIHNLGVRPASRPGGPQSTIHNPQFGTLYLVPVPIGCAEDISLRALRVLREVDWIAAENVQISRRLLEHWGISGSLLRYGGRAGEPTNPVLLTHLLAGQSIALVCDAGMPGIVDPGMALVRTALNLHVPVVALPGPVAALVALIASGLSTDRFAFDGFPPRAPAERQAFFNRLAREERTLLLYESAAYLRATLRELRQVVGPSRRAAVANRLTQPGETWTRGTLTQIEACFRKVSPCGEYAVVIEGRGF